MTTRDEIDPASRMRTGEIAVPLPGAGDASVYFIGRIRTPWLTRADCPKRGDAISGQLCRLEIAEPWLPAIEGVDQNERLQLLYWMHLARRDLVRQSPRSDGRTTGTFALRSPVRPNPIASAIVNFVRMEENVIVVRGLDCIDQTPLIDIKPERCPHDIAGHE